ncbi:MAG: uroporphyrinogen decarboxylase family protein [Gemmatimonadota bacterium]|nr:MAG: uroporphyrinogen decarboxylase family protein [Gemmatimonadota bacterium]
MNSLKRTLDFIRNRPVDRPPFHPIVMRFAARYANVNYREFCIDYKTKYHVMMKCAEDFSLDWVTVMSDPYAETEAFGLEVVYPENDLPRVKRTLDIEELESITVPNIKEHHRLVNRVREIEEYQRHVGEDCFIVGWVEGPMAEYANLRGLSNACLDLIEYPDTVRSVSDIIMELAVPWITAQIRAGAHCIGIGDAACSQIGPQYYLQFFFERQKILVEHIHSLGALAKLHICGDTTHILPDVIKTGVDIIDVDHLVPSMADYVPLLGEMQVLCGNSDPVSVIQNGNKNVITESVFDCYRQTCGRGIVSAGCEITPETPLENFRCFRDAVHTLSKS